jgi:hypothetical protein
LVPRQGTPCLIPLGLKAEACLIGLADSRLLLLELLAKQQLVIQATWGAAGYHHRANVAGKSHNLIAHRCVIAIAETLIHPAFGAVVHLGGELGHLAMDAAQRERSFAAEQGILATGANGSRRLGRAMTDHRLPGASGTALGTSGLARVWWSGTLVVRHGWPLCCVPSHHLADR